VRIIPRICSNVIGCLWKYLGTKFYTPAIYANLASTRNWARSHCSRKTPARFPFCRRHKGEELEETYRKCNGQLSLAKAPRRARERVQKI